MLALREEGNKMYGRKKKNILVINGFFLAIQEQDAKEEKIFTRVSASF
jgi:hypothetical protein